MQDLDYEVIRSVNSLDTLEKDGGGLDDLPRTLNYYNRETLPCCVGRSLVCQVEAVDLGTISQPFHSHVFFFVSK